jgi:hypothetical protein
VNTGDRVTCELFDEHADELALGQVGEPLRSNLLAHAGDCPHCHSLLDGLGTVVDRLLLVAPQAEPPAGFESRALARIGVPAVGRPSRRRTVVPVWVAAVALIAVGAGTFGVAWLTGDRSPPEAVAATIVTVNGAEVGEVRLIAAPHPHVLVTVDAPRPGSDLRHCELQRADGTWVKVGTWEAADLAAGVWAVGVDAELLDATAMRVTTDDGTVLATASFG